MRTAYAWGVGVNKGHERVATHIGRCESTESGVRTGTW
jgi:hypothetical protein